MAEPILTPSLTPTASPVDRFVRPVLEEAEPSQLDELARVLTTVNPKLQNLINDVANKKIEKDTAAGVVAENKIDPKIALEGNREGWRKLISEARKADEENGTDVADQLLGASPHFRRGLVKARAQRVGLGLDDHLRGLWNDNTDGIKDVDDPAAIQAWAREKAEAYTEASGIEGIDPVIVAENYVPRVLQATDSLVASHQEFRAKKRITEFEDEFASGIGLSLNGFGNGASDVDTFLSRLTGAESSGNKGAFRTNKDGRSFAGLVQMGQGRLDDWAQATGNKSITPAQYAKLSGDKQIAIARWHIADIDGVIKSNGFLDKGWSLDGLRAVAHLGGSDGMKRFVMSGGKFNPSDELKTSLSDYYTRFSGPSGAIQARADEAVANGVSPKVVNTRTVEAVVAEAMASGNPAVLSILNDIDTGNGPLGNIGWVKSSIEQAEQQIENRNWQEEKRQREKEGWEEAERRKSLQIEGFRAITQDPSADHGELVQRALDAGFPELALRFEQTATSLSQSDSNVSTNHEEVVRINRAIYDGGTPPEQVMDEIDTAVISGQMPSSVGRSLYQQLEQSQKHEEFLNDSFVQRELTKVEQLVLNNRTIKDDLLGSTLRDGTEDAVDFRDEVIDEMINFLEKNEEPSLREFRVFMKDTVRRIAKEDRFRKLTADDLDGDVNSSTASSLTIEQVQATADKFGLSLEQALKIIQENNSN